MSHRLMLIGYAIKKGVCSLEIQENHIRFIISLKSRGKAGGSQTFEKFYQGYQTYTEILKVSILMVQIFPISLQTIFNRLTG